jgi:dephospho-CoA kinase
MIIGITGGIACGKSMVTKLIRSYGLTVFDADTIVHDLQQKGKPGYDAIVNLLGDHILLADGELNRRLLAAILFSDGVMKAAVEGAMFTLVKDVLLEEPRQSKDPIFWDVPLLFQAGMDKLVDDVWVVECDENVRLRRLMDRNHFTIDEAKTRIAANPGFKSYSRDVKVINNSYDESFLQRQVYALLHTLKLIKN